ncbi:MAG: glutamate racemase [Acidobacteriota bacterium]|nr:glutamate racemase [Acidobacteriota bacterium]
MPQQSARTPTIGVFDSGFGGLTVLRALLPLIPGAHYVYVGDTARLPYGSKSRQTIARYAVESARFLHQQGADLLVIACNTASALALPEIRAALPIPVIGVIQPGTEAAQASLPGSTKASQPQVLVLATSATVQSHAYADSLRAMGIAATEKACPLLVPLAEEGWIDHPVTAEVLRIYLAEALAEAPSASTLLLGCTHYPLLKPLLQRTLQALHHPMTIIDSADATAQATASVVAALGFAAAPHDAAPVCSFYATDSVEKFQRLGSHFLGQPLPEVKLLDLGG